MENNKVVEILNSGVVTTIEELNEVLKTFEIKDVRDLFRVFYEQGVLISQQDKYAVKDIGVLIGTNIDSGLLDSIDAMVLASRLSVSLAIVEDTFERIRIFGKGVNPTEIYKNNIPVDVFDCDKFRPLMLELDEFISSEVYNIRKSRVM